MYQTRATNRGLGYHRIYGETTKRAPEASVLNVQPLDGWVERRGNVARLAWLLVLSHELSDTVAGGTPSLPAGLRHQG
jgi:hypothetical protein